MRKNSRLPLLSSTRRRNQTFVSLSQISYFKSLIYGIFILLSKYFVVESLKILKIYQVCDLYFFWTESLKVSEVFEEKRRGTTRSTILENFSVGLVDLVEPVDLVDLVDPRTHIVNFFLYFICKIHNFFLLILLIFFVLG